MRQCLQCHDDWFNCAHFGDWKDTDDEPTQQVVNELEDGQHQPGEGRKYDANKTPYELIPFDALESVAEVLRYGAEKYSPRNWERGFHWSRVFSSTLRHLFAFFRGEDTDAETGHSHLAHAATNIFFLLAFQLRGTGTDDRQESSSGSVE